jgi:acyl-coenzyme A synthetase/AMP-(fatty) acid ligase
MATLPLIRGFEPGGALAWRDGRAVRAGEFLRDVARLAARLPARRHVLNLCADRYRFAVGLAAALSRQQVSLLPPNETPDMIGRLASHYPDLCCLCDREGAPQGLETVPVLDSAADVAEVAAIPEVPAAQIAAILFTSGSTGQPVAHPRTWGSLVCEAFSEVERLDTRPLPGMAVLATVPPQHAYGLEFTVVLPLQGGLAFHAGRPLLPADVRAALAALPRPRALVTTPVHLRALLAEPDALLPADLVLSATAPLPPLLAAEAEARFGAPLYEIYGCTEAGGIAARRTIESVEWRAMRDLALRTDGAGTWAKGGHVETEVLLADVIELLGPARFLLHGRTADLVNIAGKRTSLAHLNYHLNSIEGVRDGAFVVPEENGEDVARLTAFVVAPGHTNESLMSALRQRIDAAFLPRPLRFVDALPRNATGKLPRQAFAELESELARKAG